ncbi:MAG: VOC family protein [Pseudomonadota bacterium]
MTTAETMPTSAAAAGHTPEHGLVWAEVPVTDLETGIAFYTAILGGAFDRMDMGPDKTAVLRTDPPMLGASIHLYEGKPALDGRGPTVHLTVADSAEAAADRAVAAGAKRLYGPIEIPYGRFIYIEDPDGNSVGLFEAKAPDPSGMADAPVAN